MPQEAEREAEGENGALVTAARSAQIMDASQLGLLLRQAVQSSAGRVIWMRVMDPNSTVLAEAGTPIGNDNIPALWPERSEAHQNLTHAMRTPQDKAYVNLVRFRIPQPGPGNNQTAKAGLWGGLWTQGHRSGAYLLEIALPIDAVAASFCEPRQNLFFGISASLALLAAMLVLGVRAPIYLRGRYLEKDMQLAKSHSAPVLIKTGASPSERLSGAGPVLGLLPSATYSARSVRIQPGDTLLIEAENSQEEEFADECVLKIALGRRTPHGICQGIMAEVAAFSKPLSLRDDRTLPVIRFPRSLAAMTA